MPVAYALMRSRPGAYTSTHEPKLLNVARPRQSPPSAPTPITPGNAAGQVLRSKPLLPAAAMHTAPVWRTFPSHSWNAISGRSFRDEQAMVRWKMSTPRSSAASSLGTRSDSSSLPAIANAFCTMISVAGAMQRSTPATNVPCPA